MIITQVKNAVLSSSQLLIKCSLMLLYFVSFLQYRRLLLAGARVDILWTNAEGMILHLLLPSPKFGLLGPKIWSIAPPAPIHLTQLSDKAFGSPGLNHVCPQLKASVYTIKFTRLILAIRSHTVPNVLCSHCPHAPLSVGLRLSLSWIFPPLHLPHHTWRNPLRHLVPQHTWGDLNHSRE